MTLDEHLVRHRLADLFLDALPPNAHESRHTLANYKQSRNLYKTIQLPR